MVELVSQSDHMFKNSDHFLIESIYEFQEVLDRKKLTDTMLPIAKKRQVPIFLSKL